MEAAHRAGGLVCLHDSRSTPDRDIENAGSVKATNEIVLKDPEFELIEQSRLADRGAEAELRECTTATTFRLKPEATQSDRLYRNYHRTVQREL